MTPEQEKAWHANRRAYNDFVATPIGKAFQRLLRLHGEAWRIDSDPNSSKKRMNEAWVHSDKATAEFRKLLDELIAKAAAIDEYSRLLSEQQNDGDSDRPRSG